MSTHSATNSLLSRLKVSAQQTITSEALAGNWFDQTISVRLDGMAALIDHPDLLNHFRRSFLGALGPGASAQAAARHPCPWDPPCTLDVFRREQFREDGVGLPKPFIPMARLENNDLIASIRVFGLACDWLPHVEAAFVDALRHRVPWRKMGASTPNLLDREIETCDKLSLPPKNVSITLEWITPFDAEKIDASEKTGSILTRLHRRIQGMARWHDCTVEDLKDSHVEIWEACSDPKNLEAIPALPSYSGTKKSMYFADAASGSIRLINNADLFWPLLVIGERCAVGRGATRGRGQFRILD